MGKSYERDGLLGKYVEHYDDDGNKIGESREREGLFGKYVEHTDAAGNKIGESRDREGFFGAYTEHTDTAGRKTGESRDREGFFGSYTEHTDRSGRKAGESREREGFLGRYTEHEGTGHRGYVSKGVDSQPSADNGCAQVLAYLVGIAIFVVVVSWLALNIVLPVLLLNSALILTILAVFRKPRRVLLANLALLGAFYMLFDIGNAWFSANFVNNVVKDPQWITGFVWLNAAAVAVSAWLLIQPLWAKAVVLRTSGTRKDLQYSILLFGACVAFVLTPAVLLPTIYYRLGNSITSVAQSSSSTPGAAGAKTGYANVGDSPRSVTDALSAARLHAFVIDYLAAISNANVDRITGFYAQEVDYFAKGLVSRDFVHTDKQTYFRRWPTVKQELMGRVMLSNAGAPTRKQLNFQSSYEVESPQRHAHARGTIENTILVALVDGEIRIVGQKEKVTAMKR